MATRLNLTQLLKGLGVTDQQIAAATMTIDQATPTETDGSSLVVSIGDEPKLSPIATVIRNLMRANVIFIKDGTPDSDDIIAGVTRIGIDNTNHAIYYSYQGGTFQSLVGHSVSPDQRTPQQAYNYIATLIGNAIGEAVAAEVTARNTAINAAVDTETQARIDGIGALQRIIDANEAKLVAELDLDRRQLQDLKGITADLAEIIGKKAYQTVSSAAGTPEGSFVIRKDNNVTTADIEGIVGWAPMQTVPSRNPGEPSLNIVYRLPAVDEPGTDVNLTEAEQELVNKYEILDGGDTTQTPPRPRSRSRAPSDPQVNVIRIPRHQNQWLYLVEQFTPLPGTGYHTGAILELQIYKEVQSTTFRGIISEGKFEAKDGTNNLPQDVDDIQKLVDWLNTANFEAHGYHFGEAAPASTLGHINDLYFRSNGQLYEKTSNTDWVARIDYATAAEQAQLQRGIDATQHAVTQNTNSIVELRDRAPIVDWEIQPDFLVRRQTNPFRISLNNFIDSRVTNANRLSLIFFSYVNRGVSQSGRIIKAIEWTPADIQRTFSFGLTDSEIVILSQFLEQDIQAAVALDFADTRRGEVHRTPYKYIPILLQSPYNDVAPNELLATDIGRTHAESRVILPSNYTDYATCQIVLRQAGANTTFNITIPDLRSGTLGSSSEVSTRNAAFLSWDAPTRVLDPREDGGIFVSVTLY